MIPKAPNLVMLFAIFYYYQYCIRIIEIYHLKLEYGTKKFIETLYCSYNQGVDKSK